MTKAKVNFADTAIAALSAAKASSAANKKKKESLTLKLRNENIAAFLESADVAVKNFNDLYLAEKVIAVAKALTATDLSVKDFNENSFCALKTAIICADATRDLTRKQVRATISHDKLDAETEKFTYRRKNAIATKRQEDLNIRLLETLNIVSSRDSKEILKLNDKSHALKVAKERIATMTL